MGKHRRQSAGDGEVHGDRPELNSREAALLRPLAVTAAKGKGAGRKRRLETLRAGGDRQGETPTLARHVSAATELHGN